jgi:tyrosyl-tRNA synthetase
MDVAELTRNAVDVLPLGELECKLGTGRPLRVKLGIDVTAPHVTLGNGIPLQRMAAFQRQGHTGVLIVGDYTTRIGDPSGRSATRPMLDPEEIDRNAQRYFEHASTIIDPDRTELRFNSEWLSRLDFAEILRLARTTTVARLLERDDFAKRYAERSPISVSELLYPLMQAYDSVAVEADVELGGTDQLFNLLLGRDIQEAYGVRPQSVLTMPILPGIDGVERMAKSAGNYVGVTDLPEEMFGKLMRVPDEAMPIYYELLLDQPFDENRPAVESKRALARELVTRFHGPQAARDAEAHFDRLHVERGLPDEIEEAPLPAGDSVHMPALIRDAFGVSASEARRLLSQGGVKLDGEPLTADDLDLPPERLDGAVLQLGKRRFKRFRRLAA